MQITAFPDSVELVLAKDEYRELGFVKDFRNPKSGVTLNQESITLVRESYERMRKWIYEEQGRFENPAALVTSDSGSEFNAFLNLKGMTIGLDSMNVSLEMRKSFKHFFDNADNLIFKVLDDQGFLTGLDVDVPYIIEPADIQARRFTALITTLSLLYQLYTAILELAKVVAAFLDVVGTGPLTAVAQLAAVLIWTASVIIALIQSITDLKELFFPKLRYFKAYSMYDLIRKGCEKLGYTFQSTVLQNELFNWYILGRPETDGTQSFQLFQSELNGYWNKGYPTSQDSVKTLGDLIEFVLTTFNCRIFAFEGSVVLERRLYFANNASIKLVPTKTDQDNHDDVYAFNDDEVWGRTYDHWQVDYSDIHSPDADAGMKSEYITEPLTVINQDLVNLTGLKENSAPFALGSRKYGYTRLENEIIAILQLYDATINAFGGSSNATANVSNRDGVLIIEKQYFGVTKMLILNVTTDGSGNKIGKQVPNYRDIISMDNIYNFFKQDLQVINNNYAVKEMTVPFTDENFISLLQNNFVIYEPTGEPVEVVNIEWNDRKNSARIIVLLPDDSAFNTKTTKLA